MRLTKAMINELKPFFLNKLPAYIEKKMAEIQDDKKHEDYLNSIRKKTKKIVVKSKRPFCKSISSLVVICLKHYGFVDISIRNARFFLANQKAIETLELKGMDELIKIIQKNRNNGSYTLGVGYSNGINDFHSVVYINHNMILDMTADQMNRPEHNLIMKNFCLEADKIMEQIACVIDYSISHEIKPDGLIFTHPKLNLILNTISKGIAQILELEYKSFNNVNKYYKNPKNFHVAK